MAALPKFRIILQVDIDPSKIEPDSDQPTSIEEVREQAKDFAAEITRDPAFTNANIQVEELPQ